MGIVEFNKLTMLLMRLYLLFYHSILFPDAIHCSVERTAFPINDCPETPACAFIYEPSFQRPVCGYLNLLFSSLELCLGLERDLAVTDTLHALEVLGTVDKATLVVLTRVHEICKIVSWVFVQSDITSTYPDSPE